MTTAASTLRLLRRLAAVPAVRAVLTRPGVERVVSTFLRSSTVRESLAFVARELPRRRLLAAYHLRESGFQVFVRHGTPDVATLDDVFYARHYELPDSVAHALTSLGRRPEVVDLGANIGLFGAFVLARFPEARISAFEPDPWNVDLLRRCVAANGREESWRVLEAAASNRDGSVPFSGGGFSLSRIEPEEGVAEIGRVASVDVFPYLEQADLIKIDIEGGEWDLLFDPRFQALSAAGIVLEHHPHMCPHPDPRETATRLLRDAGYVVRPTFEFSEGQGMLWAWPAGR